MTAVYSAHNSNRFYLRQAIHKSFPYRFSEIKLLKHFYPWASSTVLPNLYRDYRGKNTVLGPSPANVGCSWFSKHPCSNPLEHWRKVRWLFQNDCTSVGSQRSTPRAPSKQVQVYVCSPKGDQAHEGWFPLMFHKRLINKIETLFTNNMKSNWSDPWDWLPPCEGGNHM